MTTVSIRRLDSNWDPVHGHGKLDFISDSDAVAQIIAQRLKLFTYEWWADQLDGIPMFQSILGTTNSKSLLAVERIITARILSTNYVTGVSSVSSSFDAATRAYSFSCMATTLFGSIAISTTGEGGIGIV